MGVFIHVLKSKRTSYRNRHAQLSSSSFKRLGFKLAFILLTVLIVVFADCFCLTFSLLFLDVERGVFEYWQKRDTTWMHCYNNNITTPISTVVLVRSGDVVANGDYSWPIFCPPTSVCLNSAGKKCQVLMRLTSCVHTWIRFITLSGCKPDVC